jgi:hypothetical protein
MFCIDYIPSPSRTVFFFGTGRSGTTWISNLVNYKNEYRDIFEPFHPKQMPLIKHFGYNLYLRPDNRDPRFLEPARRIVTGRFDNKWADRYNRRRLAGQRIIKDVRVTHFAKWLRVNFPEMPMIYILRHPLAVIASWRALGWAPSIEIYTRQAQLVDDHLLPYLSEIEQAAMLPKPAFEHYLIFWCIENIVPLQQFQQGEIFLAFYEDLLVEPERAIHQMFTFLHKPYDSSLFDRLDKPSSQTRPSSSFKTKAERLDAWRTHFSKFEIDRALKILSVFGIDKIYTDALTPLLPGDSVLGRFDTLTVSHTIPTNA